MELEVLLRKYISNDSYTSRDIPASHRLYIIDLYIKDLKNYLKELHELIINQTENDENKAHHLGLLTGLVERIIVELNNENNIVNELNQIDLTGEANLR
ncbi:MULTISPECIES: hypothetical protein [unclassified Arcicella]|uniref:hypothetical protein n=1 Tax=unclassified Arcicella TaxID=2644986 RepID=UPI00285B4031|nr:MULTISPECIES: hypothetical protein [unclassified Arcicella]MDR6561863.1 hypothetical protein [Arcicella sp. BE51]MDR6814009.1 hypothetical protein [Arcicella sp. BE140]MDR6825284.1 hypothetical protein [Arcicella sp. BE139]